MAKVKEDGIYQVGDAVTGSRIKYRKGAIVGDHLELTKVGDWPEAAQDAVREGIESGEINTADVKVNDAPEAKVNPAPKAPKA
jgi:hypothetical protein